MPAAATPARPARTGWASNRSRRSAPGSRRVLMTTEGTYPYAMGGVSTWCDLIVTGLPEYEWQLLPIVAGDRRPAPMFELPAHAFMAGRIDVWSERLPPRRRMPQRALGMRPTLPAELARQLIGWDTDHEALIDALVWCRKRAEALRPVFRSTHAWDLFLAELRDILEERHPDTGPAPDLDTLDAARLYQTLYWVARTAAVRTPPTDLLHVTAAGWAAIPALVHKALYRTPLLLTEHGVYVREAYLAAARSPLPSGERFLSSRLARGMGMATYTMADVIAPVTEANAGWELGLGVDPARIRVIHNGIAAPQTHTDPPGNLKVVSVGRIDPLKDVQTMLRVAVEVLRRLPEARFEYWGPPTKGREAYAQACDELRRRLGLGDRFRFMGSTSTPLEVVRGADVVLMTSISEGMPLSILEAMAQARPVVATGVGGVPDVLRGCGIVVPPGDIHALATGVAMLLRNPEMATQMGRRAFARVHERYTQDHCLSGYRDLLGELTEPVRQS
jgi:glycosyltransferase involved in cell wall biosynthesis